MRIISRTLLVGVVTMLSLPLLAQTYDLRTEVLKILKKYDQDSYYMVTQLEKSPRVYRGSDGEVAVTLNPVGDWTEWIEGDCECNIISDLNTLVHEVGHGYGNDMAYSYAQQNNISLNLRSKKYQIIYHTPERQYLIEKTKTFPAKEFSSAIPSEMHRLGRYDLYISDYASEMQSTQSDGVYGILDEWNSYYLGTRNSYRLFDYYKNRRGSNSRNFKSFMSNFEGSATAYLEFKIYLLQYLIYAKMNYPEIYRQTISNRDFLESYKSIDYHFSEIIKNYEVKKVEIQRILQADGVDMRIDEDMTWIGKEGQSMKGIGNFGRERKMMSGLLNTLEYRQMNEELWRK